MTVVLLAGCGSGPSGPGAGATQDGNGAASCAAEIEYDGRTYLGHGELKREPATTGRVERGTRPGCDDGGGASGEERVQVAELADVPMARAVLVNGSFYVARDEPFPEQARPWFRAPRCDSEAPFELTGDWVSVQGPRRARFDGDLRTPYRAGVRVTDGPDSYLRTMIEVHATDETDPLLGPRDVKTALWRAGGQLIAEIECDGGRFRATSLRSTPGEKQ